MKNGIKTLAMWLIIGVIFIVLLSSIMTNTNTKLKYSELVGKIDEGKVESVVINSDGDGATVELSDERAKKQVNIPNLENFMNYSEEFVKNGSFTLEQESQSILSIIISLLTPFGILIIFFLFWFLLMGGPANSQGGGKAMSFGKSKARMMTPADRNKITFEDVAGVDEEKEELQEIVEFLKNPKKFTDMGARIPKGVLLVGQPGTGKTLLAKAVAGEAGVPFFSISGSDFVEMFVGVGASRVRSLFEDAKKAAPAIIFIDEIDAVGRRRGAGMGGGNDEREQTLNQLLIEMDGFEGTEGVIVIAATNRSDVLDPALLRPGRFDRKVLVGRPDVKGREAILRVHAKNKPLADDVNLKVVAQQTPGFVGADLENVLNEAALVAARRNKTIIDASDIDEAEDRVIAGPSKKDKNISQKEREMVAYHEAGHTIVGLVLSNAREVHKVTIVPRGRAGGYMIALPKEDQNLLSKDDMKEQLAGLMGGRVAEEIIFNAQTTGASNDFEQATQMARAMVTEYGMSDKLGPGQYEGNHAVFTGQMGGEGKSYSAQTAQLIDEEVRDLLTQARETAATIIQENRETHKLIAEALLKYETLDAAQIKSIYETGEMPEKDYSEEETHALSYDEIKEKMSEE